MIEKVGPTIYNTLSIYKEAGGGGGSINPEGYKIYQRLEMKSGNFFPQGDYDLGKIKFNFDDVIILDVDLKPEEPSSLTTKLFLRAQATNGYSRFVSAAFHCRKNPIQYYRYDTHTEFGPAESYPSENINCKTKSTKNSLTINGYTLNVAREDSPEFSMLILGSGVSNNWSFYSFKVLDETENLISQYWLPALEIATNKKGIVDIKSGRFVAVYDNNNANLYSEINL